MCGIVGVLSKHTTGLTHFHMDAFQEMLFADQLRGKHGTGIFYDNRKKRAHILKGPITATEFLSCDNVGKAIKDIYQEASFVMGHNRHATRGGHTFDNTHPFRENHITLIHNGTLTTHKYLKDVEVDSHAICHSMGEIGEEATLKKIDGAFALVWYNSIDKKLRFIRNTERPLHLIDTMSGYFLSSELGLAEWIIRRNKITITESKMLEVGQLYTFDPQDRSLTSYKVDIKEPYFNTKWSGSYSGKGYTSHYSGSTAVTNVSTLPIPEVPVSAANNISFDYKINEKVTFSPITITPHNKTYYLEGLCDGPLDTPDVYIKFYNESHPYLVSLLANPTLQGEVMQVVNKTGIITLILKNISIVHDTMEAPPIYGTLDDPYIGNIVSGVH